MESSGKQPRLYIVTERRFVPRILVICEKKVMVFRTALLWNITQRVVIISCRYFGTILSMGPISCPETSVRSYHHSLRNNPEERSSQLFRGRTLKLLTMVLSEEAPEALCYGRERIVKLVMGNLSKNNHLEDRNSVRACVCVWGGGGG
jgi:hypothetical protein